MPLVPGEVPVASAGLPARLQVDPEVTLADCFSQCKPTGLACLGVIASGRVMNYSDGQRCTEDQSHEDRWDSLKGLRWTVHYSPVPKIPSCVLSSTQLGCMAFLLFSVKLHSRAMSYW